MVEELIKLMTEKDYYPKKCPKCGRKLILKDHYMDYTLKTVRVEKKKYVFKGCRFIKKRFPPKERYCSRCDLVWYSERKKDE